MTISVAKLYEFLDSTSFLYQGDILELLDNIIETGKTKIRWRGEVFDLSADGPESEG
jgi:hypothetical protein